MRLVAFFRASFLDGGSLPVYFHIKTPHIFRLSSFFSFLVAPFFCFWDAGTYERLGIVPLLADKLTLFKAGDGADYAHHISLSH